MADKPLSLTQEIARIDEKLLTLIAQRTRLLAKAAQSRRAKGVGITDAQQEKTLWNTWRLASAKDNLDPQLVRRLFHLTNTLAYAQAEKDGGTGSLCLYPRRKPVHIDLDAPRDQILASILMVLAAVNAEPVTVAPFQGTDLSLELMNALRQFGLNLTAEAESYSSTPVPSWSADNTIVYAGQGKFHLYLLLCLSLGRVTKVKFTGATRLKVHDLRPIQDFLPTLGARLTTIEPHSTGLPARLEASGQIPDSVTIPPGFSKKFILALAVAATTYPKGLVIHVEPGYKTSPLLRKGIGFLQELIPEIQFQDATIVVPPGPVRLGLRHADVPMDPLLSLHVLAFPFFHGGTARLRGTWPPHHPHLQSALDLLEELGLRLEAAEGHITATMTEPPQALDADLSPCPEYFPLILALSLGLKGPTTLRLPQEELLDTGAELLTALGVDFERTATSLRLNLPVHGRAPEGTWQSPDPFWTLAAALASFTRPGFCISGADNVSSVWPWFWKIYMNLPEPQLFLSQPQEPAAVHEQPKRKRIRIQS